MDCAVDRLIVSDNGHHQHPGVDDGPKTRCDGTRLLLSRGTLSSAPGRPSSTRRSGRLMTLSWRTLIHPSIPTVVPLQARSLAITCPFTSWALCTTLQAKALRPATSPVPRM